MVQVITWANVALDYCRHMTSLGHNELIVLFNDGLSIQIYF